MATSFNFELNGRPNKQGRFAIFIRITEERRAHKVKTSITLARKSDWNKEKQKIRSSERNAETWNAVLEKELERAKEIQRQEKESGRAGTASEVAEILKGKGTAKTLLAYVKKVREGFLTENKLGSWKKYGSFEKILEGFLTSSRGIVEDIPLLAVTASFVDRFEAHLRTLPNQRAKDSEGGLNPNTINKLLRCFRAVVNKAYLEDRTLKAENNPFANRALADIPVTKEKLNADEIEAIKALELEEGSLIWHARNAFLLSFYCAGIRASDMIQMKWANIKQGEGEARLTYQMGKNNKLKDIVLVSQAQEILLKYAKQGLNPSDYIFPYLDNKAKYAKAVTLAERKALPVADAKKLFDAVNAREAQINKQLRKIAALAGINKPLSFHISRHSFAKAAKAAETDNALLKGLMNHSSLSVTEGYMKEFDTTAEDAALKKIFAQQDNKEETKKAALLKELQELDADTLAELLKGLKAK